MLQTMLATTLAFVFAGTVLLPTHAQKKPKAITDDDKYGMKVYGMPKRKEKYPIKDLPAGTQGPPGYTRCADSGVYFMQAEAKGLKLRAVIVHFEAQGDYEFEEPKDPAQGRITPISFNDYVPGGWVALTFTWVRDSYSKQPIRIHRTFAVQGDIVPSKAWVEIQDTAMVDRGWVEKDPSVSWDYGDARLGGWLTFSIDLPKSAKNCIEKK